MFCKTINKEMFHFKSVEINKPLLAPVHNRLYDIFEISCKFEFIESIRLTIKTE